MPRDTSLRAYAALLRAGVAGQRWRPADLVRPLGLTRIRVLACLRRRNAYISVLQKVADKYKDRPYSYLWAQGGAQAGLEGNLGVGGFGE